MKGSSWDWKQLKFVDQKLLEALELKQFVEVDRLIKDGADVNVNFGPGDNALHYFNDVDIIEKLISCGASVNHSNSYRETPLMHAVCYYKDVEIVKLLLKHGAWSWYSKRHGETAMSMALRSSFFNRGLPEKVVKTLLEFGTQLEVTELPYPERIAQLLIKLSLISENVILPRNVIANSKTEYVVYADECEAEVKSMDSVKFNGSSSLLDIVKNWRRWLQNESIMKLLNDHEQRYPIYGDVLFDRIHTPIMQRRNLLSKLDIVAVIAKSSEHSDTVLNMDCKRHIMKYVSNKDLESFLDGISEVDDLKADFNEPNAKRVKN